MQNQDITVIPPNGKIQHKYYQGAIYAMQIPDEWILNELPNTGRKCKKCIKQAMWRSVLIGYCEDCAVLYDYKRGPGFYGKAVEYYFNEDEKMIHCAYKTYLKDVNLDTDIGKLEWDRSDTMDEHYDMYEKMWNSYKQKNDSYDSHDLSEIFDYIPYVVPNTIPLKTSAINIYNVGTVVAVSSVFMYYVIKYLRKN